jgi:hypothetical protein
MSAAIAVARPSGCAAGVGQKAEREWQERRQGERRRRGHGPTPRPPPADPEQRRREEQQQPEPDQPERAVARLEERRPEGTDEAALSQRRQRLDGQGNDVRDDGEGDRPGRKAADPTGQRRTRLPGRSDRRPQHEEPDRPDRDDRRQRHQGEPARRGTDDLRGTA